MLQYHPEYNKPLTELPDSYPAGVSVIRRYYRTEEYKVRAMIFDLYSGGAQIARRIKEYIPRRPGEDNAVYQSRLLSASYTPIMPDSISRMVRMFSTAPYSVDSDSIIEDIRSSIDERQHLQESLISLFLYGRSLVIFDTTQVGEPTMMLVPDTHILEAASEEVLYITYEAGRISLKGDSTMGCYIHHIYREGDTYTHEVYAGAGCKCDDRGALISVERMSESVRVEYSNRPFVLLEFPSHLNIGSMIYSLCVQYLRIESCLNETTTSAGYVQRVVTPFVKEDSLDAFSEVSEVKTGNAYVMEAQKFSFEEVSGSSITSVGGRLKAISSAINQILGFEMMSDKNQSGVAKRMDFEQIASILKAAGERLAVFYSKTLDYYRRWLYDAAPDASLEPVRVTGFETFNLGEVDHVIETTERLVKLPIDSETLRLQLIKLSEVIHPNLSTDLREYINSRIGAENDRRE